MSEYELSMKEQEYISAEDFVEEENFMSTTLHKDHKGNSRKYGFWDPKVKGRVKRLSSKLLRTSLKRELNKELKAA